ncbi:MAG: hypothetical protein K2N87_18955 [Eubacterium sp.]|nr:hypothetical protein [Eubacterium sp.]
MKPFHEFRNMDASFWAVIKFVSEKLGYTDRRHSLVKYYSKEEMWKLCQKYQVNISDAVFEQVLIYAHSRADLLNQFAESMFMDANAASDEYRKWEQLHRIGNYFCKLPFNKQKGDKKQIAFFTSIINIITEKTIRELTGLKDQAGFDDDPHGLAYIWDDQRHLIGASSRRYDGAYPNIENPKIIWEIKEYYYATTFGSRVADGIYETQLDGYELKELFDRTGYKVYHVLFIDAYRTWWEQGKSYLCRLVDAMNSGVVDEIIVGREVLTRWPELLRSVIMGNGQ